MPAQAIVQKTEHPHIVLKEGTCGGKPIIEGTRIKVSQIAMEHDYGGRTPDEIVEAHPHLTLAQIHDALSYYYDHVDEINDEIRAADELVEELRQHYSPSILEKKLGKTANLHE